MDTILGDIDRVIVPGLTHWNHPGFFGYFAINPKARMYISKDKMVASAASYELETLLLHFVS